MRQYLARPRKGASAMCCSLSLLAEARERPWFGAPFSFSAGGLSENKSIYDVYRINGTDSNSLGKVAILTDSSGAWDARL